MSSPKPNINWWRKSFDHRIHDRIKSAIDAEHISQGKITKELEQQLGEKLGVKHVIATSSGSTALMMALIAVDLRPGDEVIIPLRSWIATANAVHLLGGKVIFADLETQRPIIDASKIETLITEKTKAIIPVHMNGRSADMEQIKRVALRHKIFVIEDAAQALFSYNHLGPLGTQSDIGCFSMSVSKLISSGQGGFAVTNSSCIAEKLRLIRTHGVETVKDPKSWDYAGFNFRYTDILASIALVELESVDEKITHLRDLYLNYENGLSGSRLSLIPVNITAGELPIYIECIVDQNREKWISYLASKGCDTRPFYPDLCNARYLSNRGSKEIPPTIYQQRALYLPSGTHQSLENVETVITAILSR